MDNFPVIPIIYQDEYLVIINKPSGWLVHRSWLDRGETKIVMLQIRDQTGRHVYPVHRLDKATSGLMVMAFNSEVAHALANQFENHSVEKYYDALVRGYVNDSGIINYSLSIVHDKIADRFATQDKLPQEAITHYWPIQKYEVPIENEKHPTSRYTLMRLKPITGRKHQLRRHMSHLRHPIIGDTSHGDLKKNRLFNKFFDLDRLMLHASMLKFEHPILGTEMIFSAPIENEVSMMPMFEKICPYAQ